jgi:predicted nucleic acid-binding protein
MTYLLDSSVLIDAINDRNARNELLERLSGQDILLACCSINVTEVTMGMRPSEEKKTEQLLRSLEFCPVTWETPNSPVSYSATGGRKAKPSAWPT